MRFRVHAACFWFALAVPALVAVPIGCGELDVVIARVEGSADAGAEDIGAPLESGSEAGSSCSGDAAGGGRCADGGSPPPPPECHGDGGNGPLCSADDDARARRSSEEDSGKPCASNHDCMPSGQTFCAKPSCKAAKGQCQERPLACDDGHEAAGPQVCGCDGVNYWNDCLRMRDGVVSSTTGTCTDLYAGCDGGAPPLSKCPVSDAYCFIDCGESAGICWVLPDQCPEDAGPFNWQSCGSQHDCVNLCTAIQSTTPHVRVGGTCQ